MAYRNVNKKKLIEIIKKESLMYGDFILASGEKSKYYLNVKRTLGDWEGLALITDMMIDIIEEIEDDEEIKVNSVGGIESGSIPIVGAISITTAFSGHGLSNINNFYIRKTPKKYGTNQYIEGKVENSFNVIIIEDVITTGNSIIKAVNKLKEYIPNCNILCILSVIDRLQGGTENLKSHGYQYRSLLTIDDLRINM